MIDVNRPVTNPDLVEAIHIFQSHQSTGNEAALIDEIINAHFIVPVTIAYPDGEAEGEAGILPGGTSIKYPLLNTAGGDVYYMAFTDWAELMRWRNDPKQKTIITTYDDFVEMLKNNPASFQGFSINPYGQNLVVSRQMIKYINSRRGTESLAKKGTKVILGEPAEYPGGFIPAVTGVIKKKKDVKAAYLLSMLKDGVISFLMVLETDLEDKRFMDEIMAVALQYIDKGMALELATTGQEFGESAVKGQRPFYRRKAFGIF